MMLCREIELTENEFRLFRELIYQKTGITLSEAKRNLVRSRLQKRLRFHEFSSFGDYYRLLREHPEDREEQTAFINCITTNKTDFYREAHHFEFVLQKIVPDKIRAAGSQRLRVWHAGCSTGEEPYTLAITLQEALAGQIGWNLKQLASDIDTEVLAYAQRGVYPRDRVEPIPAPLLKKYFLRGTGEHRDQVRVKPVLQQQIAFKRINLLAETWPFSPQTRFDLIFCRNVVIYFDKPTQAKLFRRFAQQLTPGGYLFIGHSETLQGVSDQFESLGSTIYRLPLSEQTAKRAA